jgi:hypothetical protein
MIPIPVIQRAIAIHNCAAEKGVDTGSVGGVLIRVVSRTVTICATDGKLLIEERHSIQNREKEDMDVVIRPSSVLALSGLIKGRPKEQSVALSLSAVEGSPWCAFAEIGNSQSKLEISGISFPSYEMYFNDEKYPRPLASTDGRIPDWGLELKYLSELYKCWKQTPVRFSFRRGIVITPLKDDDDGVRRRALLMPISLPQSGIV